MNDGSQDDGSTSDRKGANPIFDRSLAPGRENILASKPLSNDSHPLKAKLDGFCPMTRLLPDLNGLITEYALQRKPGSLILSVY